MEGGETEGRVECVLAIDATMDGKRAISIPPSRNSVGSPTLMVTFPHAAFKTGPKGGRSNALFGRRTAAADRTKGRERSAILQPKYRSSIKGGKGRGRGRGGIGWMTVLYSRRSFAGRVRRGSTAPPIMLNAIPGAE